MKGTWRLFISFLLIGSLCLSFWGCGGSVARYNPGPSGTPTDLVVIETGDGNVTLGWSEAFNAAAYNVYYSTSPGVTKFTGTKFGTTTATNAIVTGLENDTQYYFVVTAVNSSGESGVSNEVSATPAVPGPIAQTDLTGIWRFNILVSGTTSGWMRGTLTVDDAGAVTINPFSDNAGGTTAPDYLFPTLRVNPTGQVRDALSVDDTLFKGVLGGFQRKLIVGTLTTEAGSHLFIILQKHDPAVTFSASGDIAGFGKDAGGSRGFSYSQISSGSLEEWEFAVGQIGQKAPYEVQYSDFINPSGTQMPGSDPLSPDTKVSSMSISSSGVVTEARGTSDGIPAPTAYIAEGYMSDDKSLIVGVDTDSVSPGKYVMRIYGMVNIIAYDANSFSLSDLAGSYSIESLIVGTTTMTASGILSADGATGAVAFDSYQDSTGNTTPPDGFTLAITSDGILSSVADATLHGKMAYNKDVVVCTKTETAGVYSLSVALKSYLEE
ncbi:MAG: fibronectin type III domain-containing protein [Geobacteraceae bacterium]|nr:fibronectin type III domain-containing protein [Geobacteraceae bacterium]